MTIHQLAESIGRVVDFDSQIFWDASMPDGVLRKLMDSTRLHQLGWRPQIDLMEGIGKTYATYNENLTS